MAKVILDPMLTAIHGRSGNLVFRRSRNGDVYTMKLPDMSKVKWSEAQKGHRERFKEAIAYAKAAMAEPTVRAQYEKIAAKKGGSPFFVAVSDYFKGNNLLKK
jgi:hypothetical protein